MNAKVNVQQQGSTKPKAGLGLKKNYTLTRLIPNPPKKKKQITGMKKQSINTDTVNFKIENLMPINFKMYMKLRCLGKWQRPTLIWSETKQN